MAPFFLLVLPTSLALASFLLVQRVRERGRALVGEVIESSLPGGTWRTASTILLVLAGGLAFGLSEHNLWPLVPAFLVGLLVNLLRPNEGDRVTGTEGVRAGWNTRRYEELEEWRLTGDHLRFKLFGQWTAVPLALDKQAPIHARLLECVPERESEFNQ